MPQQPGGQFWGGERELLVTVLFPLIMSSARQAAENAIETLPVNIGVDWALVNKAAYDWAWGYTQDLARRITDTTQNGVGNIIADWITSGQPLEDLVETLTPFFGPVRAEMIAVTEVTRAFAEGNILAWKASGVVDGMKWMTAQDDLVCPICEPLAGQTDDLDGDFNGDGPPPAHVRCRCYLQPVIRAPNV
jgi:SPP1 gp7 family putative phage head morphogenesis protein